MGIRLRKVLQIRKHFFEFSFNLDNDEDEIIPDFKIFQSLNSAEQYYLADIYNWDDGPIVLDWIIDSPKCDKGTACMIFWRAEPDYYFQFSEENIDEFDKDIWSLIQKIIMRFKANDFAQSKFEFIPEKEKYRTDWPVEYDLWLLPDELKNGVVGKKPYLFGF